MGTFTNDEYPDAMPQKHSYLRKSEKYNVLGEIITCAPQCIQFTVYR